MKKYVPLILVIIGILVLSACSQATPAPTTAPTKAQEQASVVKPTEGQAAASLDGKKLMETACTACHGLDKITSKKMSADQWKAVVDRMVEKGAALKDNEKQAVIDYLAATYPK